MLNYIQIQNFRGISHARVHGARRLNVLVGPNGTGKTAFLEAVYLATGNSPQNLIKTKQWRGRETQFAGSPRDVYEAIWSDTFRDPMTGRASIEVLTNGGERRFVEIEKTQTQETFSAVGESRVTNAGMVFRWHTPSGTEEVVPKLMDDGIQISTVASAIYGAHFLPARMNMSEAETARAFSKLSVEGVESTFLKSFNNEFPWLEDVGVEAPSGPPALYARMPSGRKLPLTMISGGISQLAGLMLRIVANPNALLLVDEIENGFYYERYASIWRTLFELAVTTNSQLFVTSHSLECLQALRTVLADNADDILFIRSRLEQNEVEYEQLPGDVFFGALDIGEVR